MTLGDVGFARLDALLPIWRARFFVETSRSPCISTMSGFLSSSSITSVFTTACSSTPSFSDDTRVPPLSS
jgi:hypothetical protein